MNGEPAITPEIRPEPPRGSMLDALVARARAALVWERVWPQFAAAGCVVLLFLALSWFGLFDLLPPWGRIVGVAIFGALLFVTLNPVVRLAVPGRAAALARIDRASAVRHRPATALDDTLPLASEDAVTRALWAAHREQTLKDAKNLRAGLARPHLAARDPRALRFLAALVALVAFVSAGDNLGVRTLSAFDWRSPAGGVPPRLDAWVAPPPYTGRPPIFLTASQTNEAAEAITPEQDDVRVHTVPSGSVLVIRSSGGRATIDASGARELAPDEKTPATANAPRTTAGADIAENRFVLEQDAEITIEGARTHRVWRFAVTPDTPPQITFRSPPRTSQNGALVLDYTLKDDYGITAASASVAPRTPAPRVDTGARPARPLYGPPEIRLVLPQGGRSGDAVTNLELVEHPWAGTRVAMTLVARDEPGQEGRSETIETVLPERPFSVPLARALIEQRRVLALDADARQKVMAAIDALSLYPEKFTPKSSVYLGLRAAHARLYYARSDDELRSVVDYLWEFALKLEDGDLSDLAQRLKQAEQNLRDALERNAPDEEIAQLMQELREALGQFIQEMARRMEQQQPGMQARLPPGARVLTPEDLNRMLDQMENLARGGNRQAAQDMLSQLRDMLNNLQTAQPGQMDPGSQAQAEALDELGRMIREQSDLRDRTFRQRRSEDRLPNESDPGQLGELGQEQGALEQRLEEMLKKLEGLGVEGDPSLGDAGEEMGAAEGHLGQGDANRAFNAQGRALEALRKGAQGMAERMMQGQGQAQGQEGQQPGGARPGQRAGEEDTDPLGRPTRARRYDPGSNVRVPGEIEAQRARRVLEELRKRLGEPNRPQEELDYYERLLRD